MGREIRRVPADWEHPKTKPDYRSRQLVGYQPMHDRSFEEAAREWMDAAIAWDNGTDPDCAQHKAKHPFYWQWSNMPPNPAYYRPKWTSEPTHYQVYETVTEGTPVTPHFATKAELIDWLVEHGDDWDHGKGWSRESATSFVEEEWAPSLVIADGVLYRPKDGLPK